MCSRLQRSLPLSAIFRIVQSLHAMDILECSIDAPHDLVPIEAKTKRTTGTRKTVVGEGDDPQPKKQEKGKR